MVKRNSRPFQIAVGRVDKSTSVGDVNSAKNQQAYMYPGGKIVRAPLRSEDQSGLIVIVTVLPPMVLRT